METSVRSPVSDWRLPTGKDRLLRERFPGALPTVWWFWFHARRPPTDEELAAMTAAFVHATRASVGIAKRERSTAIQGNPHVVTFVCDEPPKDPCVEVRVSEHVCPLYLVTDDVFDDAAALNFERTFGEADNPFRMDVLLPSACP